MSRLQMEPGIPRQMHYAPRNPIFYLLQMPWENDWLAAPVTEAAGLRALRNASVQPVAIRRRGPNPKAEPLARGRVRGFGRRRPGKFRLSTALFFGHFVLFFAILRELNSYLVNYCRFNFCRTAPLCGIDQSPFPRDGYGVAGGEAAGINGLRRHPTSSVPRMGRWFESTRKLRNCQFIIAKISSY